MGQRGRIAGRVGNPRLREARLRRGWTEDDVAVRLHQLSAEVGEPAPGVSGPQVGKWERGVRNPGRYYRPRLCVVFEATPGQIGLAPNPRLLQDIGALHERRVERQHREASRNHPGVGTDPGGRHPTAVPSDIERVDTERLQAILTRLWPVDAPLLVGLNGASRRLAERRDTEAPSAVMPALQRLLDVLIELLSRPQMPDHSRQLRRIAAFTGQNLAMASWIAGDAAATHRTYAIAESLARESRSASQLALILVDRSEMAGQLARVTGEWEEARLLADAAETAALMDSTTPAGVLAWIYGERATQRAMVQDELGSGRDLERMEEVRLGAGPGTLNVFSPGVDSGSGWIDVYQIRRALQLGQSDKAIRACERVLSATDRRLVWQVSEALVLLVEALTARGDVGAAALQAERAVNLTNATENERDTRELRRALSRMRQRWSRTPEMRRLDELIRSASP